VKFFSWRRCADPDNLADETITRALKAIAEERPIYTSKPYSYIYGIASNVFREYLREKSQREHISIDLPPEAIILEDSLKCREICLRRLSPDKLNILETYYAGGEERRALAQRLRVPINTLRGTIHRIKQELRACYEECLK
jgi:RNA polymerase sigma factor (sigma-70 family)